MKCSRLRATIAVALLLSAFLLAGCSSFLHAATGATDPATDKLAQARAETAKVVNDVKATTQSLGELVATLPVGTELQAKATQALADLGKGLDALQARNADLDAVIKEAKDNQAAQAAKAAASLLPSPWDKVATSVITALAMLGAFLAKRKGGTGAGGAPSEPAAGV